MYTGPKGKDVATVSVLERVMFRPVITRLVSFLLLVPLARDLIDISLCLFAPNSSVSNQ